MDERPAEDNVNAMCGGPRCRRPTLIVFGLLPFARESLLSAAGSKTKAEFPFIGFRTAVKCIRLTITLHNKLRPASRSAAADRLDHRPSGNQDQRDQAGVWSSDQDRQPAGRDERPSCDHHRDAGQHQPGPVPHYLLVSTGDRPLLVQCEWKILVSETGSEVMP